MAAFEPALAITLQHEGGFYNNARTGEVVNRGVTLSLLRSMHWPGTQWQASNAVPASPSEIEIVKNLTEEQTSEIYRSQFWYKQRLNEITDQALAAKVFDLCVNTGNSEGGQILQRAINRLIWPAIIPVDGIVGNMTIHEANSVDPEELLRKLKQEGAAFYDALVNRKPELAGNLAGWKDRVYS